MLTYKINIKNQGRKKTKQKKNEQDEDRLWNFIFF